jgi:hypothetical protein
MTKANILRAIEQDGTAYIRDPYGSDELFGIHMYDSCYVLTIYEVIDKETLTIDYPNDLGCFDTLDELMEENIEIRNVASIPFKDVNLH